MRWDGVGRDRAEPCDNVDGEEGRVGGGWDRTGSIGWDVTTDKHGSGWYGV